MEKNTLIVATKPNSTLFFSHRLHLYTKQFVTATIEPGVDTTIYWNRSYLRVSIPTRIYIYLTKGVTIPTRIHIYLMKGVKDLTPCTFQIKKSI